MHRPDGQRRVRKREDRIQRGPQGPRLGEVRAQAGHSRFDALLGLEGEANAVARHEFEQAQRQFRLHLEALRGAEVDALPMHNEIGVGHARAPVPELRE